MIGLIGKKIGMTQIFNEKGEVIPVTVLQAGPCTVVQKKVKEKDGYDAIQLGFEDTKENRANKPLLGHFKKSGLKPKKILREIRVEDVDKFKESDEIKVDIFSNSKYVNIQGLSKGKGFTGVMKRWGFAGMPATHGTHKKHRHPGSIGQSAFPGRVFKGLKMAGRTGNKKVTVRKLAVAGVDPEKNILMVKGAVPGSRGSTLLIYSDLPTPADEHATEKQTTEKHVDKKQVAEKQATEQQIDEGRTTEKPAAQKQATEEQEDQKQVDEKQTEEKQKGTEQTEKKQTVEKQADTKPPTPSEANKQTDERK
jgi:large subunit ribosomal protein L3